MPPALRPQLIHTSSCDRRSFSDLVHQRPKFFLSGVIVQVISSLPLQSPSRKEKSRRISPAAQTNFRITESRPNAVVTATAGCFMPKRKQRNSEPANDCSVLLFFENSTSPNNTNNRGYLSRIIISQSIIETRTNNPQPAKKQSITTKDPFRRIRPSQENK